LPSERSSGVFAGRDALGIVGMRGSWEGGWAANAGRDALGIVGITGDHWDGEIVAAAVWCFAQPCTIMHALRPHWESVAFLCIRKVPLCIPTHNDGSFRFCWY
jgi:hypothetical protein